MFGKGVFQEEENLLRDIIRSIDKKVDYEPARARDEIFYSYKTARPRRRRGRRS